MILQLSLRNWRAYDNLDLELGPGTTFIVASNGTGKTSLILAAAWGVFGEASGVDGAEEIRGDAESASVEVVLRLPVTGNITIRRTVNRKGKSQLEAALDDRVITNQEDLRALISEELGGDLQVIARLTFLAHGGALETSVGEFQLREHLAAVFGVTPLLEAARSADKLAAEAAAASRRLKAGQKTDRQEKDKLAAAAQWVDEELGRAGVSRADAVTALNEADELRRRCEEWARYRSAMVKREQSVGEVAEKATALHWGTRSGELLEGLMAVEQEVQDAFSTSEKEQAAADAQLRLIEEAAGRLRSAGAACPTCLRPLSEHESLGALQQHDERLTRLKAVSLSARQSAEAAGAQLFALRELLSEVRAIPLPAPPPGEEVLEIFAVAAVNGYEQARDRVQEVDQLIAQLYAGKNLSLTKITELEEAERQTAEIITLLRQEGVAKAGGDAFRATADAITQEQIEPLVAEVGRRWKLIFGSDGLRLSPLGEITREMGSRVLPFKSLSGGEKVWALLLTRLLITGASTRAPFVWLDEPLEHLDPRLRRVVAGTLARASHSGGLRQVVVTTYESELARQLMEDVPSASLIYVRGAG